MESFIINLFQNLSITDMSCAKNYLSLHTHIHRIVSLFIKIFSDKGGFEDEALSPCFRPAQYELNEIDFGG